MKTGISNLVVLALGLCMAIVPQMSQATPEYANKEKKACNYCHVRPGGPRNFRGMYYRLHNHDFSAFDEVYESKAAGVAKGAEGADAKATVPGYPKIEVPAALNFTVKDIDGGNVNLGRYNGSVVVIVNVASKCGNTPQYAGLEKLYEKYKDKGLVILGFPANEFGKQEPGTDKEIKEFCTLTYKVAFPMFSKIVVKGEGQADLYKTLTTANPKFAGDVKWNFTKFLVDRQGNVLERYAPTTEPKDIAKDIEKLL